MDNRITPDEKIRIAEIAAQLCKGSLKSFNETYKEIVDLITNYKPEKAEKEYPYPPNKTEKG